MFYKNLRKLMEENNVSNKQLTDSLHVGKNQIKYWEKHGNVPNGIVLHKIADYFGVSVDTLLNTEDENFIDDTYVICYLNFHHANTIISHNIDDPISQIHIINSVGSSSWIVNSNLPKEVTDVHIRIISSKDKIAFMTEYNVSNLYNILIAFINMATDIQCHFFNEYKVLSFGYITTGKIHLEDNFYSLSDKLFLKENNVKNNLFKYPRIVIDKKLLDKNFTGSLKKYIFYDDYTKKGSKQIVFVNYLYKWIEKKMLREKLNFFDINYNPTPIITKKSAEQYSLENHYSIIESLSNEILKQNKNDDNEMYIIECLKWLQYYHTQYIEKNKLSDGEQDDIISRKRVAYAPPKDNNNKKDVT